LLEADTPVLLLATGSPAWRGSAAVEARWTTPAGSAVDATGPAPWLPQGSGVQGIATDRRLAVLGERRLFACGGALAGHDAARDQTAFGLAVATAVEAAKQALEEAAR
jgi:anaerobic glycerol-3-phosphate dehydrogenase